MAERRVFRKERSRDAGPNVICPLFHSNAASVATIQESLRRHNEGLKTLSREARLSGRVGEVAKVCGLLHDLIAVPSRIFPSGLFLRGWPKEGKEGKKDRTLFFFVSFSAEVSGGLAERGKRRKKRPDPFLF